MAETYRTELMREQTGEWTVWADANHVANGDRDLTPAGAKEWANEQLGEGMSWLNGRIDPYDTSYWVA